MNSPTACSPASTPTPRPRPPRRPHPAAVERRAYPPLESRQDFGAHDQWRARQQPLSYAWEERARPWLLYNCQKAKALAREGVQRANVAIRDLRHESPERQSPLFVWCAGNVHRVGLSPRGWLPPLWAAHMATHVAPCAPPHVAYGRGEKSGLGDDDWLLPD